MGTMVSSSAQSKKWEGYWILIDDGLQFVMAQLITFDVMIV
jgi:hypothetical protein